MLPAAFSLAVATFVASGSATLVAASLAISFSVEPAGVQAVTAQASKARVSRLVMTPESLEQTFRFRFKRGAIG